MKKFLIFMFGIIVISLIIYGGMASQHNKTLANIDDKLKEVDAAAAHLVDVCSSVTDDSSKIECNANILNMWHTDCVEHAGKLDSCKPDGPIEKYLKVEGFL